MWGQQLRNLANKFRGKNVVGPEFKISPSGGDEGKDTGKVHSGRPRRHKGGGEAYLYSFFNLGARWWWVVKVTPRPLYALYRRLDEPQGVSGRVRKISPPLGIRFPDRPARRKSLYCLSYPGLAHIKGSRNVATLEWELHSFLNSAPRPMRKISPPPGFDPRTVQPELSRPTYVRE